MRFLAAFLAAVLPCFVSAQPAAAPPDKALLQEIERDIWRPFMQAYETGDVEAYIGLHSESLVRALGDAKRIEPRERWLAMTRNMFKSFAAKGARMRIDFRFLERFAGAGGASERGIFEFVLVDALGAEKRFYGQFHVIARKEADRWKILVDYDTRDGGRIDEASYRAAHAMDDYARF